MPAPDIKIDLFISYSKYDEPWARKLYVSLQQRGIRPDQIFFDKEYMRPGVVWEQTMSDAVRTARVLVCFWSKKAQASPYVVDERAKFDITMRDEDDKHKLRTLIMLPLEETLEKGDTDPYMKYQWGNDILATDAYAKGIGTLDPNIWSRLVDDVYNVITADTKSTPITLIVVAMTRDRIDFLDFTTPLPNNETLANAIKKMGIITDVSLLDRMDPTMRVPGGTLEQVLQALKVKIAPTTTAPNEPPEIHIQLPGGDSLGKALEKKKIMTVDDLLSWLRRNPSVLLPNGSTLDKVLNLRGLTLDDLEALMIKTALRQYYSDSPLSWRPFGGSEVSITTIMKDVQGQYNTRLQIQNSAEPPFRWQVAQDFWSDAQKAKDVRNKVATERSVIVVDPLSLYEPTVANSFTHLYPSFDNEKALIMAFAPFALPTPTSVMRELIKHQARRIWDYFFEPEFKSGKVYAKCGPDVGDATDINRWLLHALKPEFGGAKTSSKKQVAALLSPGHDAPNPAGGALT